MTFSEISEDAYTKEVSFSFGKLFLRKEVYHMCERYITVILHCIYYIRIQTWFNANEMVILIPQEHTSEEPQVINLDNIYMMDGSCISTTQFSGCGWIWKDNFGKIQLMGIRNLRRRDIGFNSEVGALRWEMESILQHSSC